MKYCLVFCLGLISFLSTAQKNASIAFEKWLSLKQVGTPVISPNGKYIAYTLTSTDWTSNGYDSEIWLSKEGGTPIQLTRTSKGSSSSPAFTPDNQFISFLSDRGEKTQLYLIPVDGGEALQITKDEDGIGGYEWSPNGRQLVYTKADPDSRKEKAVKERYGAFAVEGEEYKLSHLWLLPFNYDSVLLAGLYPCYTGKDSSNRKPDCYKISVAKKLTDGNFTVAGFSWSPTGTAILFNKQPNPLINSSLYSDIALVDISTKKIETLISNPSSDGLTEWAPDGNAFIYRSSVDDSISNFFRNGRLFIYDLSTKKSREIGADIDENKSIYTWNEKGIYFGASQKMKTAVYRMDPQTGISKQLSVPLDNTGTISFARKSDLMAIAGRNFSDLNEIYYGTWEGNWKKVTNINAQISNWNTPVNEIVEWKSKDGASIEGVLLKPRNFDPSKKYPLLVMIHGGPTGIDRPEPTPGGVYPVMQWVEKGALVLRVNYRGSAGYGEKFRSLNVRNLGVGDMWDVVSGIESLQKRGFIDTARMGCMGWSQGGYISAFLTTNTTMFKAISVGAGISNWITYYVSTDITPFTRQYLKATPWEDMSIYQRTSPMTNINKASTPTLIQHGEFDKRVPIPNAYELYRGLQDRHIPSKLVVYKGFGHGITKPKERLAAIWHNWLWFNHYVFGEPEESLPVD
ncbi:MAG: S9 family peptidase [Chitinophagaceae bacterium]|nr:MAG: S9 family peptidase [Chitinophagaceae bacterium]